MANHSTIRDIFLVIISIFLPPLAVGLRRGVCNADFLINIALCLLGFLPGLVHAWYIIAKYPQGSRSGESQPLLDA